MDQTCVYCVCTTVSTLQFLLVCVLAQQAHTASRMTITYNVKVLHRPYHWPYRLHIGSVPAYCETAAKWKGEIEIPASYALHTSVLRRSQGLQSKYFYTLPAHVSYAICNSCTKVLLVLDQVYPAPCVMHTGKKKLQKHCNTTSNTLPLAHSTLHMECRSFIHGPVHLKQKPTCLTLYYSTYCATFFFQCAVDPCTTVLHKVISPLQYTALYLPWHTWSLEQPSGRIA